MLYIILNTYVFYFRNLPRPLSNILDIFRYDIIAPSARTHLLVPSYGRVCVPRVSRCRYSNVYRRNQRHWFRIKTTHLGFRWVVFVCQKMQCGRQHTGPLNTDRITCTFIYYYQSRYLANRFLPAWPGK